MKYGIRWTRTGGGSWVPFKFNTREGRDKEYKRLAASVETPESLAKVRLLNRAESNRKYAARRMREVAKELYCEGFDGCAEHLEDAADNEWPTRATKRESTG